MTIQTVRYLRGGDGVGAIIRIFYLIGLAGWVMGRRAGGGVPLERETRNQNNGTKQQENKQGKKKKKKQEKNKTFFK